MQKFLTSTALALTLAAPLAAPAFAESDSQQMQEQKASDSMSGDHMFGKAITQNELMASDLIGARLYTAENGVDETAQGMGDNWNDVGEISDIVVNKDGQVDYVIADIGGFLGMGEKPVAVSMSELKFISDGQDADEYFIVLPASKAALEDAPAYQTDLEQALNETGRAIDNAANATANAAAQAGNEVAEAANDAANATANAANDAAQATENAAENTAANIKAEVDENTDMDNASNMTAEELTGTRVYDANGKWIGEVDQVLMSQDGQSAEKAVIDVGGFLGIGEKPVAVNLTDLTVKREKDGDDFQIHVNATKKQLEDMPTYQAS